MNAETERLFERLVVERGLVTPSQIAEARRIQAETPPGPRPTLLDLLLETRRSDRTRLRDLAQVAAVRSGAERVNIAGFELLERLGEGGMGAVYRARQSSVGRFVALKLMKPKLAKHRRFLERFLREAHASATVQHPNVVQGIDAGSDKGYYYFAMEFVDGDTLRRIIARDGRLAEPRCIEIGMQMGRALQAACEAGLVHRDVKPENIIIDPATGQAKLADLGLAKFVDAVDASVTQVGTALGTPNYISPEQARGSKDIDIRSDIYSLGATLYHAVTGTLPFDGESAPIVMSQHMTAPLDPPERRCPGVSAQFSRVIQKMMAKNREERYEEPADLVADLERVARGEQPGLASAVDQRHRRRRRQMGARPTHMPVALTVGIIILVAAVVLAVAVPLALRTAGPEPAGKPVDAEIQFNRAVNLVNTDPANVSEITRALKECLERDPAGPNAATAKSLLAAAAEFESAVRTAEKSPGEWTAAVKSLRDLAARSPDAPSYRGSIARYIVNTGRKLVRAARERAAGDPLKAPDALRWLDAVGGAAPDESVAAEVRAAKSDVARALQDGAGFIFDSCSREAEREAKAGHYKAAVEKMKTCVPAELASPALADLLNARVAEMQRGAARHFEELRGYITDSLDHASPDMAKDYLAEIRRDLDFPEFKTETDALGKTVGEAPRFLPLLAKLDELDGATPRDPKAIAKAASDIARDFGKDPYVARRIKKYETLMQQQRTESELRPRLKALDEFVAQKKFGEADDVIAELLRHPALSDAQRRNLVELRTQFGTAYCLVRVLVEALQGRVPVNNVPIILEEKAEPAPCRITAASRDSLAFDAPAGHMEMRWDKLGWRAVHGLATGPLKLVKDDDPTGLYLLGVTCFGNDDRESRRLLQAALDLAEKRTDAELPGRAGLLAGARDMLVRLREADAESAFKQLVELIKNADSALSLDRAAAAWEAFQKQQADSQYAKKNAEAVKQAGYDLADAVVRVNAGPIAQNVRDSDWGRIVERLEAALPLAVKIAPLSDKSRKTIDELLRFGKAFITEEGLYREIFSVRPWRSSKASALKRSDTKAVADRADRYSKIFDVRTNILNTVDEQRRFAVVEQHGPVAEPVRDLDTRLARYNAVFDFWTKDHDACVWTEVDVAREMRNTGYGGDMMSIIMLENLLKTRRGLSRDMRASADFERLASYARNGQAVALIRSAVIVQAKQFMADYGGVGEFAARFCLMTADEYEAAGDDDDALKFFEKLIEWRTRYKNHAWLGYLGRGRIRERQAQFAQALGDYETALRASSNWPDGFRCARAITDLCVRSGKLDRADRAEKAVSEVVSRTTVQNEIDQTRKLLEKK